MGFSLKLVPLLSIQAVYLGTKPSYAYVEENGKQKKVAEQNKIRICFATQMLFQFGNVTEVYTADRAYQALKTSGEEDSDVGQDVVSCKMHLKDYAKIANLAEGAKGVLTVTVGSIQGLTYYQFYSWSEQKPAVPAASSQAQPLGVPK